jgi:protein-S-isoprenylcysteine O-methyltransferase Ste14
MATDLPYRIALGLLLAAAVGVLVPFRVRAARGGEKISHRDEGFLFAAVLRLAGLVCWVFVFAFLIYPDVIERTALALPAGVRWSGLAVGVVGLAIIHRAFTHLGHNLTDTVVVRQNATFVSTGPYRYVRHPFYCGAAILLAGMVLLTANVVVGVTAVFVLTMLALRTPREEERLVERFGDEYRRYQATTGRFFPRIPA